MANILIVEDSSFIRSKISQAVSEAGHIVVGEAENGVQAINLYTNLKPDIVTLDITMPLMDGIETLKKLKKIDPDCLVIMLSAMGQQMIVIDCIKLGARHFIVKPFLSSELLRIIDEVLCAGAEKMHKCDNTSDACSMDDTSIKIHNITGTFVIDFPQQISQSDIDNFETVSEGLVYVKPLKVVMDFKKIEFVPLSQLQLINKIVGHLREQGEITIYSQSEKFTNYIKTTELKELKDIKNNY